MISWVQVALALLKMVNAILDFVKYERAYDQGKNDEIARESAAILARTGQAKKYLDEFTAHPGSSDDFLRDLEPK